MHSAPVEGAQDCATRVCLAVRLSVRTYISGTKSPTFAEFLLRDSYAKRGICRRRVSVCVCVCLSHSGIVSKRLNIGSRK